MCPVVVLPDRKTIIPDTVKTSRERAIASNHVPISSRDDRRSLAKTITTRDDTANSQRQVRTAVWIQISFYLHTNSDLGDRGIQARTMTNATHVDNQAIAEHEIGTADKELLALRTA